MNLIDVKNEITEIYQKKKGEASKKSSCVKPQTLENIIQSVKFKRNVMDNISSSDIRMQIYRHTLINHHVAYCSRELVAKWHH